MKAFGSFRAIPISEATRARAAAADTQTGTGGMPGGAVQSIASRSAAMRKILGRLGSSSVQSVDIATTHRSRGPVVSKILSALLTIESSHRPDVAKSGDLNSAQAAS